MASFRLVTVAAAWLSALSISGADFFVAPESKAGDGSIDRPFGSVDDALMAAEKCNADEDVRIILLDGLYYLDKPIVISPTLSRQYPHTLSIEARNQGAVTLSGGQLVECKWHQEKNGIFSAALDFNDAIDQLYVNGRRQRMARFPNVDPGKGHNVYDTWSLDHRQEPDSATDPLSPERIRRWSNPAGAYLHAMHGSLWGDMHWKVTGVNPDGTLRLEGGWQNNRPAPIHPLYRIVENVREELDEPEEWFYDHNTKRLYYMPQPETDLKDARIETVSLRSLIEIRGTAETPVVGIAIKGIRLVQTARTFMDNREPLLRSDWTTYRGGAMFITGSEDCSVTDCVFDQVGGTAVFVSNYNRHLNVERCLISESGANGIAFVGNPACVRSPLFGYGQQDYDGMDLTAGAVGDDFPSDCKVEDCLMTLTGRYEKQTAPIQISMSQRIHVNHCSIYRVPRAGINISEGTFGGHVIENCDIFDTVLETGDHGSFNSWGRDRYWTPDVSDFSRRVKQNPRLTWLDMTGPNVLRHNRWRCDHGWDIDLDDGSSHYLIYDNLMLGGGLKMREGYDRRATNNVIINNSLHPHVWPSDNGDVFSQNIVMGAYQPALMTADIAADGKWGEMLDYNFFATSPESMKKYETNGNDKHSVSGDPQFINPEAGDFRVSDNSDALKVGFRNFSMTDFGVRSPRLRAIAESPAFPKLYGSGISLNPSSSSVVWNGATLSPVTGEAMSAFGVAFDLKGLVVDNIPDNSSLLKSGLRKGDLIIGIDGNRVESDSSRQLNERTHSLKIVRSQDVMVINL